jgi:septum formation protein
MTMVTIILASGSPRRRELLQKAKVPFKVIHPNIDEDVYTQTASTEIVTEIAKRKVEAVVNIFKQESPRWIVGADTMIEVSGQCVGKPESIEDAEKFIRMLSGRIHRVHTGLALLAEKDKPIVTALATSEVKFRKMTDNEIHFYLNSGEWSGAAGAYRIQEQGSFFIEWIRGSYSNVVGLPLETFYKLLRENDYPFFKE